MQAAVLDAVNRRAVRLDNGAQRHEVGVAADVDGLFGAELDAGIAFGAQIRFLVEALVDSGVQRHKVVGTDVDAEGAAMLPGAGGAFVGVYECRHGFTPESD